MYFKFLILDWEDAFKSVLPKSNKQMDDKLQHQMHLQQQQFHQQQHIQQQDDIHRLQEIQKRNSLLNSLGLAQINRNHHGMYLDEIN